MQKLIDDFVITLDPVAFAKEKLNFIPDEWQTKVLRSEANKIILKCSRQAGKSTTTAILALHKALFFPDSIVLLISASLRQSRELFRKVQDFLSVYREKGGNPVKLVEDNKLECKFKNSSRIISLPAKEQTIRGFSKVNLIIEDEASRVEDEVYYTIRPMLAVSQGRIILLSTPFGKRGHFYKEWSNSEFEKYDVPADKCPRISKEFLEAERRELGEFYFKQEYECEFIDIEGIAFKSFADEELYSDEFKAL